MLLKMFFYTARHTSTHDFILSAMSSINQTAASIIQGSVTFLEKCDAKEHCEKVLHWLHKLYCNGIISDYSIRMRLVYFDTDGFSDCERDYCENDIRALNDLYADLQ